jgi:hypothetical protein
MPNYQGRVTHVHQVPFLIEGYKFFQDYIPKVELLSLNKLGTEENKITNHFAISVAFLIIV